VALEPLAVLQAAALDMEDGCSQLEEKGRAGSCLCRSCSEDGAPRPWLDEQAQRLEIGFVVYSPEYGLFSLVTVNFFFNRGGRIQKLVHVQSSWANDFDRPFWELALMVSCDLLWILSLTYVLACEVSEVVKTVRSSKQRWHRSIREEYLGLWNTVDWISIACAYLVVAMFLRLRGATAQARAGLERLAAPAAGADREGRLEAMEAFFELVEDMCAWERIYRMTFTIYPMVVMARLFKSFDAQPRLAVVTRTLVSASSDMTHFFIVFLSVYSCMAVNGMLLFGQDLEDFATWERATVTCFRMMFGDWDYEQMRRVGLLTSALWLWIFVLVIGVLLLNMLLAILMDAYGEVKSNATDARTLFKQISEILRRRREFLRGKRVRLTDIWAAFFRELGDEREMLESREPMTAERVLRRVPGMKPEQAKRTLAQAEQALRQSLAVPYTQEAVKTSVDTVDSRTRRIREELQKARNTLELHEQALDQPAHDCSKEPQVQVADAVLEVVGQLSEQISETLADEGQLFEGRQQELESRQDEILVCAKDAHCALQQLRARSDRVMRSLQQHLSQQGRVPGAASGPRAGALGLPWASCTEAPRRGG